MENMRSNEALAFGPTDVNRVTACLALQCKKLSGDCDLLISTCKTKVHIWNRTMETFGHTYVDLDFTNRFRPISEGTLGYGLDSQLTTLAISD
jgi:hypothetical protein